MGRSRWRLLVDGLTILLLFVATAEIAVRAAHPTPRLQVIRASVFAAREGSLTVRHGQPTWRELGSAERAHRGCAETGRRNLVFLGTSISFGINLRAAEVFTAGLQVALDQRLPGMWCVMNFAQPGYTLETTVAEAHDRLAEVRADAVILEVWNLGRYVMIGGDAYNLGDVALGPSGLPEPLGIPSGLHRWMFERSAAWSFLTLTLARPAGDPEERARRARASLDELQALLGVDPAKLLVWFPTPLGGRVDLAQASERFEAEAAHAWALERDLPALRIAEAWEGVDTAPLAMDVAHLNAAGHQRLVGTILAWLDQVGLTAAPVAPGGVSGPAERGGR